jgi:transcriptional regulator with XRE-family HTH domain
MDINDRIAERLRSLRGERGYTLDALAELSGVSRSMISLIERGQSSPTASVLDRLAAGLDVTLAALFEDTARDAPAPPVSRRADQPAWQDPASGYVRRNLSPPGHASALQLVDVSFPPGKRVTYDSVARDDIQQQVWVIEGAIELTVGDDVWRLEAGDCLAMRLDRPVAYRNPGRKPARYLVALATATTRTK